MLNERDLRALRVLRGAAQAGGLSAAERVLCMTTATISRQIKSVEESLGAKLCVRGPQGFELTQAGIVALQHAEKALDILDGIKAAVDALQGEITGKIRIGLIDNTITNPNFDLYEVIDQLCEVAPKVVVSISVLSKARLIRALIEHEIDIVIEGLHEKIPSLEYMPLFNEPQTVYQLDIATGSGRLPMVNRPEHLIVQGIFKQHQFTRGPEANSIEAVALLIATGRYCGVLPVHYANTLSSKIQLRPIDNAPEINMTFCAVTDPRRELPLCVTKFLSLLEANGTLGET